MSKTSVITAPSADEQGKDGGYVLRHVDPRTIADNPDNARGAKRDRLGLTASIKALGVLMPPLVRELEDGSLVLIAGERRKHSAIAAGLETIPVFVRTDLSEAQRLAGMLVENTARDDLTVVEAAVTMQRLAGFDGMTTKALSELTGAKPATIRDAVKVAESETARRQATKHSLTLEQAAAIAEFHDDDEAVEMLVECATEEPAQFKHALSRLRQDRKEQALRVAKTAELEAQGVVVIETPSHGSDSKAVVLSRLKDAKGKDLTMRSHAKCPGHAVAISRWSVDRIEGYCLDPAAYGHVDRWKSSASTVDATPEDAEARREERRTLIANNKAWKAAETVRREHIVELLARKSVPKGTLAFAVADCLTHPNGLDAREDVLSELTGVARGEGYGRQVGVKVLAKTTEARLPLALLAQVAAAIEATTNVSTWRSENSRVAAWFRFLVTTGYTLSDVEQIVVSDKEVASVE